MSNYRPKNLRYSDFEFEKHTEEGGTPRKKTTLDINYAQHNPTPPIEDNPNHNPSKDPNSLVSSQILKNNLHTETVDREKLLKNIDNLTNLEKVRLSRLSYLKHVNRYNVRNA